MKKTLINYYSTTDLSLATTISLFYPIEVIDRDLSHKVTFIFNRDDTLDSFIESYWKNEVRVNPIVYFNQLKFLKSRIYEGGQK